MLTRARRDGHGNIACQSVGPWREIYVYWIWLIYDEWLYEDMNDKVKSQNGA